MSMSTDDLSVWVSRTVRAEAASRGINIRQLAIRADIADKVLRRALQGMRPFYLAYLVKIADALGVTVSYLLTEAERRQANATPQERAAALIEFDDSLSDSQKNHLLGEANGNSNGLESLS